jgi:hypothetical protein
MMASTALLVRATLVSVQIFGSATSSRSQLHVLCEIRASRAALPQLQAEALEA